MCFNQILKQELNHLVLSLSSRFGKSSRCWGWWHVVSVVGLGEKQVCLSAEHRLAAWLDGWRDEDRQHYGEMCSSNLIRGQHLQDVIRSRRQP